MASTSDPLLSLATSLDLENVVRNPEEIFVRKAFRTFEVCHDGFVSDPLQRMNGPDNFDASSFLTSSISRDYFGAGDRRGEYYGSPVMKLMVLCALADASGRASEMRFRGRNVTGDMTVTVGYYDRLVSLHPKAFKSQFRMH